MNNSKQNEGGTEDGGDDLVMKYDEDGVPRCGGSACPHLDTSLEDPCKMTAGWSRKRVCEPEVSRVVGNEHHLREDVIPSLSELKEGIRSSLANNDLLREEISQLKGKILELILIARRMAMNVMPSRLDGRYEGQVVCPVCKWMWPYGTKGEHDQDCPIPRLENVIGKDNKLLTETCEGLWMSLSEGAKEGIHSLCEEDRPGRGSETRIQYENASELSRLCLVTMKSRYEGTDLWNCEPTASGRSLVDTIFTRIDGE